MVRVRGTHLQARARFRPMDVGTPAPDWTVLDGSGRELRLSELWSRRTTVLVFLRHFG